MVSLDNTNVYNVKLEEYRSKCKLPEDIEEALDYECFGNSILNNISMFDVKEIREKVKQLGNNREYFEWLD